MLKAITQDGEGGGSIGTFFSTFFNFFRGGGDTRQKEGEMGRKEKKKSLL